jgi:hypothetical protein
MKRSRENEERERGRELSFLKGFEDLGVPEAVLWSQADCTQILL